MLSIFLAAIESTVVATAMPTVVASLGGIRIYSWVFSGFLLTQTVTMPLWGRFSDLYGRRPIYLTGLTIFLVGSALSGAAQDMAQLIVFRMVQGLGAGALMTLGYTIIGELFGLERRARMQGYISSVWGVASLIGPWVGGMLTDYVSWRWVFYINLPVRRDRDGADRRPRFAGSRGRSGNPSSTGPASRSSRSASRRSCSASSRPGAPGPGRRSTSWRSSSSAASCSSRSSWWSGARPSPSSRCGSSRAAWSSPPSSPRFLAGMAMFGALSFVPLFLQSVTGTIGDRRGSRPHAVRARLGADCRC